MPDTADLGLLPAPVRLEPTGGRLSLPNEVTVAASDEGADGVDGLLDLLTRLLQPGTGIRFVRSDHGALLRFDVDPGLPVGGYRLDIARSGIDLAVRDEAGARSAVITLLQLLPAEAHGPAAFALDDRSLPCLRIEDHPRFGWRGMHLDVGRHFQPFSFLLRFVDLLELHRFNIFHLHLTEDQGWRFDVRKYPRLTEVGGWRTETWVPALDSFDGTPHGGYYTQQQLRALVAYAAQRGITVVPEIDLPGHVRALLAAYPQAGENREVLPVATTFGIFEEVLNLTDETVAMVEDIFAELLEIFPSPYIHIGGDETPRTQWRASEQARQLAVARGLGSVDDLQRWFTEHLRGWLAERGRTLVGWDEIIDGVDVPGATVMSWRGAAPGRAAAAKGYDVVMAPETHTYFDYYQASGPDEPYAIGGLTPLEKVLAFRPARRCGRNAPSAHRRCAGAALDRVPDRAGTRGVPSISARLCACGDRLARRRPAGIRCPTRGPVAPSRRARRQLSAIGRAACVATGRVRSLPPHQLVRCVQSSLTVAARLTRNFAHIRTCFISDSLH